MDIESLTAYLNASPEARTLIAHLACKLAESEATLAALSAELAKVTVQYLTPGEVPEPMKRDTILTIAREAMRKGLRVRAIVRTEYRDIEQVVTEITHVENDLCPVRFREKCGSRHWQSIAYDGDDDEGILTMEIV